MDAFRCSTRGGGSFTRREMDSCVLLLPSSLPITEPNVPFRHLFPLFTEFLRANTYELSAGDALSTIANVQRSPVHGEEFVEEFLENGRPSGGRKVSLRAKPIIFSTWPKMGELLAKISLRPPSNARNSFEQRRSFNGEGTYNIGEKTI